MRSSKLSIVIPISRMAGKLQNLRTTLSLVDWTKCEVLMVHDVQDPQTGAELKEIKTHFESDSIYLYEGTWGCPGLARNYGLEKSVGEWIIFWDSDDLGDSQNVLSAIETSNGAEIIAGGFQVADFESATTLTRNAPFRIQELAFNPGLWRIAFLRERIKNVRFPNYLMAEDQVFLARCLKLGLKTKFFNANFYVYFKSIPDQLTSNPIALREIRFAIEDISTLIRESDGLILDFLLLMLIRQTITNLKSNSEKVLLATICNLGINLIHHPTRFIKMLFQFSHYWLKFRKPSGANS